MQLRIRPFRHRRCAMFLSCPPFRADGASGQCNCVWLFLTMPRTKPGVTKFWGRRCGLVEPVRETGLEGPPQSATQKSRIENRCALSLPYSCPNWKCEVRNSLDHIRKQLIYCCQSGGRLSINAAIPSLVSRCIMFSTITSPVKAYA